MWKQECSVKLAREYNARRTHAKVYEDEATHRGVVQLLMALVLSPATGFYDSRYFGDKAPILDAIPSVLQQHLNHRRNEGLVQALYYGSDPFCGPGGAAASEGKRKRSSPSTPSGPLCAGGDEALLSDSDSSEEAFAGAATAASAARVRGALELSR